ncbi:putative membrane protein [Mycolicibacterium hassiacum DSM 44199]|uniref:Putative membrane protein n=1 Tax=Mycolicibacterium hassiacum (strain DSM 44199 / CIP 105218 / JCM 12690 / 3849) TaxID=1122247 RepID=K5BCK7_MYCHD|nr:hypothetical protein [Mycolicibacterium hassiacum]EKF25285.1 putative membrane protein [Mycolicibacterium hassiacum DSM 44199]MBX5487721.1 hypothetical protein [Mycolicibacterium hassiacum]MDA4087818.1 hypothetical protein [Mycolicibacterium hassiacum DSM 44199]VCT93110.1 hypothetical protein MHAS_04848 [Mycolicibacterium hassiacum DSM 44199]
MIRREVPDRTPPGRLFARPASPTPTGIALALLGLALLVPAVLRWQGALVPIIAWGFPFVYLLSLRRIRDRPPLGSVAVAALVGAVLGSGWALPTGQAVADSQDVALGGEHPLPGLADGGWAAGVPVGGALLLMVPALAAWLRARSARDSFDDNIIGAAIGGAGAVVFTAAATLVRLAPQLATGVVAEDRPVSVLLVQAGVQGLLLPVTAAAVGSLAGAALWSGRFGVIAVSVSAAVVLFAAVGVMERSPLPQLAQLAGHLVIAVAAVLVLRWGVRATATAAGPEAAQRVAPSAGTVGTVAAVAIGLAALGVVGVVAAAVATPAAPLIVCPPDCGTPPIGEPVESRPRYVSADGRFSVQYPGPGTAYQVALEPDGVEARFTGGDTGLLQFLGLEARGRTAERIVHHLVAEVYPNAQLHYRIPNALVGYQPGYGAVFDDYPQDASSSAVRLRIIVLAAVRDDYALVAAAVGPNREFTREDGNGIPTGANLQLALDMGKYVNSFRWLD